MAFALSPRHARVRRYGVILVVFIIILILWPSQHIENLSNELVKDSQKNDYLEEILNPNKNDDESIYRIHNGPLKADFNPGSQDLDFPEIINKQNLDEAMEKLKINSPENIDQMTSVLSNFVTESKYKSMKDISGFVGNVDVHKEVDYYTELSCPEIEYKQNQVELVHSEPLTLEDDFFNIRDYLLSTKYSKVVSIVDQSSSDGSMISDIKHWYKKSGSSIWLPTEELHMVATTVFFAPYNRNEPLASFIRLQLFNSNWEEVKERRIKFQDLTDNDIHNTLKKYNSKKDESLLDSISLKFPSILNVPFDPKAEKTNVGPEDPRMLYKDGEYSSEPLIIFNMATSKNKKGMFAVFPFRKPQGNDGEHKILTFKNIGNNALTHLKMEKNWVPFFDGERIGDSKKSRGYIHFVYTLDPLVIFRCSLDNGKCSKSQDNIYSSTYAEKSEGYMRGGSHFYPVPREIIQRLTGGDTMKRLQMWVGFPRVHIKKSACGSEVHRSTLSLLVKEDGVYRVELISTPLDFGVSSAQKCDSKNPSILNANGIAFWDIVNTEQEQAHSQIPLFDDYMGLIVGENNEKVHVVFLKNVLNFALGVYAKGNYMLSDYDLEDGVSERTRKVSECALQHAIKYTQQLSKGESVVDRIVE
ncbi:hypothetical protein DAMA08_038600 [Martiniozyma asiatica (nom. inval.)]|nr:hypothetical protein DAMA08_038600 [Martiniozyma asiatica]